jgi:hypothetical protein
MSEMIFNLNPSMPSWDILTNIFNVSIVNEKGLIGALIGIFIVMLISFNYDDWAKTLAPVYYIINSFGVIIHPVFIAISTLWFAVTIWNNTGFKIKAIPNIVKNMAKGITYFSTKNRALRKIEKKEKRNRVLEKLSSSDVNLSEKLKKEVDVYKSNKIKKINDSIEEQIEKSRKLMTPQLELQDRKDALEDMFGIRNRIITLKNQIVKLTNEHDMFLIHSKTAFGSENKMRYEIKAKELKKIIDKNKREVEDLELSLDKLRKRYNK